MKPARGCKQPQVYIILLETCGMSWLVNVSDPWKQSNCVLVSRIRWIRNSRDPCASIWRDTRLSLLCVGFLFPPFFPSYPFLKERSQNYERALREKSQVIRDTEMRSMNKGRSKRATVPNPAFPVF